MIEFDTVPALLDLSDVDADGIDDGQLLIFDETAGTFVAADPGGGAGGGVTLAELEAEQAAREQGDSDNETALGALAATVATDTELAVEKAAREAADGTEKSQRQAADSTEKSDREGADAAITGSLAAEVSARDAQVKAEVVEREAAEVLVGEALAAELTARAGADTALGARIDDEEAARAQAIDDAIDALRDGAPGALDTLKELATAAEADASGIASLVESLALKASKTELGAEATTRSTADSTEKSAREAADATEKGRAETAEALKSSKTELAAEESARKAAVTGEKERGETAENLKLAKASNLSDLASPTTARSNLGLGTAATTAASAYDAAGAAAAAQAAAEGFATTADGLLVPKTYLDTDGTLAANSDTKVATQKAVKTAVAAKADLLHASRHQLGGADPLTLPQYDIFDLLPYVVPMGYWATTTTTLTAKRGYFNRFTVARKREIKFVRWGIGTVGTGAEDKVEAVILKANGAKMERLGTSGLVKTSFLVVGVRATELTTTITCEPGIVYFVGWGMEAITGTPQVLAVTNNNGIVGDIAGAGTLSNRYALVKNESVPVASTVETGLSASQNPWLVPSES